MKNILKAGAIGCVVLCFLFLGFWVMMFATGHKIPAQTNTKFIVTEITLICLSIYFNFRQYKDNRKSNH